jgi:hypothetical protein
MIATYCEGLVPEIDIVGRPSEWRSLAEAVLQLGATIACQVDRDSTGMQAAHGIEVVHFQGEKVRIYIDNDRVIIQGDKSYLDTLSKNMMSLSRVQPAGYHLHIEFLSDNHYVASDSTPTILLYQPE